MELRFTINRQAVVVPNVAPTEPLLWVLREDLGLVGTKFGCGQAACGACTVHVNGAPQRSCVLACAQVEGQQVTTVEGLSSGLELGALQQAWLDVEVAQCGYCQAGQLMSAAALLKQFPKPTDSQINDAMVGNLCRCGTYGRIREAIKLAANRIAGGRV
jgi:isoquinoline 1-oxidoreductase subunit alpha